MPKWRDPDFGLTAQEMDLVYNGMSPAAAEGWYGDDPIETDDELIRELAELLEVAMCGCWDGNKHQNRGVEALRLAAAYLARCDTNPTDGG